MRVSLAADELTGVARDLPDELRRRGHEPILHGAYSQDERPDWAWASERAARDVAEGRAQQGIVACWTGTGASIAANKVPGIRAAQCHDAYSAERAAKSNNAQIITMGARVIGPELAKTIADAWLAAEFDPEGPSAANVAAIDRLDAGR
jgi:ribose 5-phosphate isomerase B